MHLMETPLLQVTRWIHIFTALLWLWRVFLLATEFSNACVSLRWCAVWCGSLMSRPVNMDRLCCDNNHAQTWVHFHRNILLWWVSHGIFKKIIIIHINQQLKRCLSICRRQLFLPFLNIAARSWPSFQHSKEKKQKLPEIHQHTIPNQN